MKNEMHETIPPSELPVPEIKTAPLVEHANQFKPATEIEGAKKAELPGSAGLSSSAHSTLTSSPAITATQLKKPSIIPTSGNTPQMADDNDLIEKEWVQKAKAIVSKTKDDPYLQNKEMGHYKADYIKKRFNKDLKSEN